MNWYYIDTGASSGSFNMDLDSRLAAECKDNSAYFRLYRWQPYCISLGANQDYNSIDSVKASENKLDIVKRPTGGRAILHSEELTYSVILPLGAVSSARAAYTGINMALAAGLRIYNDKLKDVELESEQPDFQQLYKQKEGNICFAVPAKSELKYRGKKLVGSAQRKLNNAVLQHGSILCGKYHRNITSYLHLSEDEEQIIHNEIINKTTELESILESSVDYELLAASILSGFGEHFNAVFEMTDYKHILNLTAEITI